MSPPSVAKPRDGNPEKLLHVFTFDVVQPKPPIRLDEGKGVADLLGGTEKWLLTKGRPLNSLEAILVIAFSDLPVIAVPPLVPIFGTLIDHLLRAIVEDPLIGPSLIRAPIGLSDHSVQDVAAQFGLFVDESLEFYSGFPGVEGAMTGGPRRGHLRPPRQGGSVPCLDMI